MITTVLMDYDSTLHDMDGVMERSLDGVLGYTGEELYHTWVYDIHRALIHRRHLDRHDDTMFHCTLLFDRLELPFDKEAADLICSKFDEAKESAKKNPIYYPDAIPALESLKKMGLTLCLSTGYGAGQKAKTMELRTGNKFFKHTFSEQTLGVLKTEPEYYKASQAGGYQDHMGQQEPGAQATGGRPDRRLRDQGPQEGGGDNKEAIAGQAQTFPGCPWRRPRLSWP
jgi:FMN phosphatase YigB (HAD superfamily)